MNCAWTKWQTASEKTRKEVKRATRRRAAKVCKKPSRGFARKDRWTFLYISMNESYLWGKNILKTFVPEEWNKLSKLFRVVVKSLQVWKIERKLYFHEGQTWISYILLVIKLHHTCGKKLKLQEGFYTADLWFVWGEENYLKHKKRCPHFRVVQYYRDCLKRLMIDWNSVTSNSGLYGTEWTASTAYLLLLVSALEETRFQTFNLWWIQFLHHLWVY